jgi:thymidylate kinase
MLVEIAGIDGSGKTTLIHAARKQINELGKAFAYERSFQSEGVRLLEAMASENGRRRPYEAFGRSTVEVVRTVDLVRRSAILGVYKGSRVQHVFCDGYIVEQYGRFCQFGLTNPENIGLLQFVTQPDMLVYLRLTAKDAVHRMKSRLKGDALLLEKDPMLATERAVEALEAAIAALGQKVTILDASQPPEVVLEKFMGLFEETCRG